MNKKEIMDKLMQTPQTRLAMASLNESERHTVMQRTERLLDSLLPVFKQVADNMHDKEFVDALKEHLSISRDNASKG